MKNTWAGIYLLINRTERTKKNSKPWSDPLTVRNKYTDDPTKISDVLNIHFSSVGRKLASKIPPTTCNILRSIYPVITASLSFSIQWLPSKLKMKQFPFLWIKHTDYTLASCPTRILHSAKHILSKSLAEIMNIQNDTGFKLHGVRLLNTVKPVLSGHPRGML